MFIKLFNKNNFTTIIKKRHSLYIYAIIFNYCKINRQFEEQDTLFIDSEKLHYIVMES